MANTKNADSGETEYENRIFIADARDMRELPDGSVHLILTSPPYFNVKDYSLDGKQEKQHGAKQAAQIGDIASFARFIDELLLVWKECARVLAPNGKLVINSPLMPMLKKEFSTHENRHIFDLNAEIQHSIVHGVEGMFLLDTYIWNRTNPSKRLMFGSYPFPTNFYAQNTIEFVTVFVKAGKSRTVPPLIKEQSKLTQEEWVNLTRQVWAIPVPNKSDPAFGTHSALMPEELAERVIRLYSFADDIVLDPFTGSGTTPRVAKRLGRRFVGYELMPSYREIIGVKVGEGVCVTPRRPKANKPLFVETERESVLSLKALDVVVEADALDFLRKLPRGCVDLGVIDPPYNLKKGEWDTWSSDEAFLEFTESWIDELLPTLRPKAGLYVFNTPRNAAYILALLEARGCEFRNWITWDKRDGFSSTTKRFVPQQETCLYVVAPGPASRQPIFNADAVRVPYESTGRIAAAEKTGILKNGKRWFPNKNGRLLGDVWHIVSERHKNKKQGRTQAASHPTVKPLELIDRLVLASSNEGDVVLDCFVGSGTTAVSAARLGRHFLASDVDPEFVAVARERLEQMGESE